MDQYRALVGTLVFAALWASGCSESVGECKDGPRDGRDTVVVNGAVQYGGQAILNVACASCHSSGAKSSVRQGAPEGLDFDLLPVDTDDPSEVNGVSGARVTLTP